MTVATKFLFAKPIIDQAIFASDIITLKADKTPTFECNVKLDEISVAYQTYGEYNGDNAILIFHALTGDQFVASTHPITAKRGWWHEYVGSGKAIDTDKYYVICLNTLGSCMGTTGAWSINQATNKPYALSFPTITIADMVHVAKVALEQLGVEHLHAVVGGSMGGIQALMWAHLYGEITDHIIAIACSHNITPQNIAFNEAGRRAIMSDPNWHNGDYVSHNTIPHHGLAVARMLSHITYMSSFSLDDRFGRNLQDKHDISYGFDIDFQVESYLNYQGMQFVNRFDPNSYLYLTRALDYFDLGRFGDLAEVLSSKPKYLIMSLSSDWRFPKAAHQQILKALCKNSSQLSYIDVETDKGHDGFLVYNEVMFTAIKNFF